MEAKIVIAGDVVVAPAYEGSINSSMVDNKLSEVIRMADYAVVNFEAPTKTPYSKPISKSGPNLYQPASVIDALKDVGFNCFTLANNHFRDFGHDACENTLTLLTAKGISYMGGGKNLAEASNIHYARINNIKVAFINVCEQEWSIATETQAGSNPLQPLTQYYQIKYAKETADYVILIHHGGVEHYQLPTPQMKQLHRFFIDAGADAVVNHHQHCFSGYEIYNGRPIFYGLGNFLFEKKGEKGSIWNYGYMVELILKSDSEPITFNLHPYEQCNGKFGVYKRSDMEVFYTNIANLNKAIVDNVQLWNKWKHFVTDNRDFYIHSFVPYRTRIFNKLCRMHLLPTFINKLQLRFIYDVIKCDSHRVRFLEFIEQKM